MTIERVKVGSAFMLKEDVTFFYDGKCNFLKSQRVLKRGNMIIKIGEVRRPIDDVLFDSLFVIGSNVTYSTYRLSLLFDNELIFPIG